MSILAGIVHTEQMRRTDLIEIRVRHPSARDACDIVNAVADVYADRRREIEVRRAERALEALEDELRDQEDLVEEKRRVLDWMRKDMERGVEALRETLQTQSELVDHGKERLERIIKDRTYGPVDRSDASADQVLESHDYAEAKREYETALERLQRMRLAHSSQRIALRIPRNPVTTYQKARMEKDPVSPSMPLCLGAGILGGGVLGLAVAVLIGLVRAVPHRSET